MRRGSAVLAMLVATGVLAGCLGADGGDDDGDGEAPTQPVPFAERTLFLDGGALVDTPPAPGSVQAGDFVLKWTTGTGEHPVFQHENGTASAPVWLAVEDATVTVHLTTDLPVLPAEGALPDVAVWLGSGLHAPLVSSARLDGPLLPGEVVTVSFDLPGPAGQPPILTLQGITLLVTVTMTQLEAHNVRILTGGDHPSNVRFMERPLSEAEAQAPAEPETTGIDGTIPFFDRVVGPAPEEGMSHADHPVEVPPDARWLLAAVEATGGGHTVDMDMALLDGGGEVITWGVTPYASEILWLWGDTLEPYRGQTLTLRVMNHLGAQMEYEGRIETG